MTEKRVTIYDVAREAGVAPSTVSRTFSRPGRVNAETGKRIREVAENLGYRSRAPHRHTSGESTKIFAFVVADITNPYLARIMQGFQREASSRGYTTLLIDSQESDRAERAAIESILYLVDGVALTSSRMSDLSINQIVKGRPVVAVNRLVRGTPSILPDTGRGMRQAVELLSSDGHERISYLAGPESSWVDGARWRALTEVCQELGIVLKRIGPNSPSLQGGVRTMRSWLRQRTTAVVAYNDLLAIGFMKAVQSAGFLVPDDVSVIGIDNTITSTLTVPTLTTLAPPANILGIRAAQSLFYQIEHRSRPAATPVTIPMHLFIRESVGSVPCS